MITFNGRSCHVWLLFAAIQLVLSAPWSPDNDAYNLNKNRNTTNPLEYFTTWPNHQYFPSPENWRFPFYTVMPDRFFDSDPRNNDFYKTPTEWDFYEVNYHHGGDMQGIASKLDYIISLGARGIYVAGTPLVNLPWDSHYYNPIDFTVLDPHLGTLEEWRNFVELAHSKGLYLLIDLTVTTGADLLEFKGYSNQSAPFRWQQEYEVAYKFRDPSGKPYVYQDFTLNNTWDPTCNLSKVNFLNETGQKLEWFFPAGCYDSDFNQFGDLEAFGNFPPWYRQLTKFAGVQDRFKDYKPSVARKLSQFVCLAISGLDIDGVRIDKATQMTIDFVTDFLGPTVRECARRVGKNNFFLTAEITSGIDMGAMYLGRGRDPLTRPLNATYAVSTAAASSANYSVRPYEKYGMDSEAFHYSVYRGFLEFMGLDGNLLAPYDTGADPIESWNQFVLKVDYFNAFTQKFDPRDLWGTSNQDTFRWPSLYNGVPRFRLGQIIISFILPGMPMILFGDEQGFYLHDSRTENYIYGRQPMTSAEAWQLHGCYQGNASYQFRNMPFSQRLRDGCKDDSQSLDRFDQTSESYLFFQNLYHVRSQFEILREGFQVDTLLRRKLNGTGTRLGVNIWSVVRSYMPFQNVTGTDVMTSAWFVFTNSNQTVTLSGLCSGSEILYAPFNTGDVWQDLLPPYQTIRLNKTSSGLNCLDSITLPPFGYRVFIESKFARTQPLFLTGISPNHDARILRNVTTSSLSVPLVLNFSSPVPCDSILQHVKLSSISGTAPTINPGSVSCRNVSGTLVSYGIPQTVFQWSATLENVPDGITQIQIESSIQSSLGTNLLAPIASMFRAGLLDNVIVLTKANNFSQTLLSKASEGTGLQLNHRAIGADLFRYTTTFGRIWSNWTTFQPVTRIPISEFSNGASMNRLAVSVQYWCRVCGSGAYLTYSEIYAGNFTAVQFKDFYTFPNLFLLGEFNKFGKDQGVPVAMKRVGSGVWELPVVWQFPTNITFDKWNDAQVIYGDVDGDGVLDRLPPNAQDTNSVMLNPPPFGYTGWIVRVNDVSHRYELIPTGSMLFASLYWASLFFIPILTATGAVWWFFIIFYGVIFNAKGRIDYDKNYKPIEPVSSGKSSSTDALLGDEKKPSVLIATLEYEIPDWSIKVRIGGLGVISGLMARYMQNPLVWVIPKVGDVQYPDSPAGEPIYVTISGEQFMISTTTHQVGNVKYVLLDCGLFRQRKKADPYTAKMDDLESAVFYSAWNQAIAEVIRREQVDIYHINDFHCGIAQLYLLPDLIPCAVSLHNAEFQGLWPMRTLTEFKAVCSVFNISEDVCRDYIQYGNTFNLIHGSAMYLARHQKGIGAGGVSDKYGERCLARYPVFWCLSEMSSIQNPNPADFADDETEEKLLKSVDAVAPAAKEKFKLEAQKWAGLEVDSSKTLLVFVGRWSRQKGIDLIADLAPRILEEYPDTQIITVGPLVDLHGKLAAVKLQHLMQKHRSRVYCKAEFTQIPPAVFKGSDFVLLPSRDEPFGLVAVEFGRNGVLGIGAFVGGLGSMPGWWFPMESMTTPHLLKQFWDAIKKALSSTTEERAELIRVAAMQRFPISEWRQKLETVYRAIMEAQKAEIRERHGVTAEPLGQSGLWRPRSRFIRSGIMDMNQSSVSLSNRSMSQSTRIGSFVSLHSLRSSSRLSLPLRGSHTDLSHHQGRPTMVLLHPQGSQTQFRLGDDQDSISISNVEDLSTDLMQSAETLTEMQAVQPLDDFTKFPDIVEDEPFQQYLDEDGALQSDFTTLMSILNTRNSTLRLCIDRMIEKYAKKFYDHASDVRLAKSIKSVESGWIQLFQSICQKRLGTWSVYCIFIGLGQILAATSFQLSLLSGNWASSDLDFSIIGAAFIIGTSIWWWMYRSVPSVAVLTIPFYLYSISLLLVGLPVHGVALSVTKRLAVWTYSFASGSGSLFFALNFGEEAGVNMSSWIFRAGILEGLRNLWTVGLWYFLSQLPIIDPRESLQVGPSTVATILCFIGAAFLALVGFILQIGLPSCYRGQPAYIPSFWKSFTARRLALWFLVSEFVKSYWLSGPYGRNWQFLWRQPIPPYAIFLLVVFFLAVWGGCMDVLRRLSKEHPWILPVFAVGLLSPRWAQMSWSTSNIGDSLTWGRAGPYVSLALWLWLGVLDAIQSCGLSVMLLQTLTRIHVAATLVLAQLVGAVAFILARYTSPNAQGPGDVFPDPSSSSSGANAFWAKPFFWLGLMSQLIISVVYLVWFRKEQLSRP